MRRTSRTWYACSKMSTVSRMCARSRRGCRGQAGLRRAPPTVPACESEDSASPRIAVCGRPPIRLRRAVVVRANSDRSTRRRRNSACGMWGPCDPTRAGVGQGAGRSPSGAAHGFPGRSTAGTAQARNRSPRRSRPVLTPPGKPYAWRSAVAPPSISPPPAARVRRRSPRSGRSFGGEPARVMREVSTGPFPHAGKGRVKGHDRVAQLIDGSSVHFSSRRTVSLVDQCLPLRSTRAFRGTSDSLGR